MALYEKQMIPLDAIPGENKDVPEQLPSKEDLVDVKFPSRPRRKVVTIAGVIAVLVVIIIAASLIGKYVPEYLSDTDSESEKVSKGKGTGGRPEESVPSSSVENSQSEDKKAVEATSTVIFQQGQTSSITTAASSVSDVSESMLSSVSGTSTARSSTTYTATTVKTKSSLGTEIAPSVKVTLTDFQQFLTSSLSKTTSLTTTTSKMSDLPVKSSMSDIALASSVNFIANLVPNTESKWTRWSSWSGCTKTCGTGTRQRNRTCVAINHRAVFAPISCAGKAEQVKSCAEWKCPDCSRNCTIGTLNAACDACTCDHHLITGRILTADDVPLSEVNISLADTPYNVLAQTNVSGHFTTLGVCADQQELLIAKAGFVPVKQRATVVRPTYATIAVKLELAVPPFVTIHPQSKTRMDGQSVTFCCDGEGNPPPEFEWFKDNNIIDKDIVAYNNTLQITDVRGLNGSYRCRLVNDFGSEFSDVVELKVLAQSEDSCNSSPSFKNVTLPSGCVLNGTDASSVDIGECKPVPCLKNDSNFTSTCKDPSFCCGPRSFENALIQCGKVMSFNLLKVKHCGCGKCRKRPLTINGIARGPDNSPAKYVYLYMAETYLGKTDRKGYFAFGISKDTKRAVVTFKDRRYKKYETEEKVFTIYEGQAMFYKVRLKMKAIPLTFNSSEDLVLPLGDNSSFGSFADIELPGESLLTEDGEVYHGNAKAAVSVTDPRNLSDVLSAVGDFSTVDEDGEEELLQTYGMIKLTLEDENGKALALSKPMKVYLDPEKFNLTASDYNNVPLKLYWLDSKTGRWREAGSLSPEGGSNRRRKRQNRVFFVGTVTPSIARHYLNFDIPTQRIGVRVTTESDTDDVTVTVIRQDYGGYIQQPTNQGVACIPIWIDTECYLQADKSGKYYDPVPDGVPPLLPESTKGSIQSATTPSGVSYSSFTFKSSRNDNAGPIYYDDSGTILGQCQLPLKTPVVTGRQFVFKQPTQAQLDDAYELRSPDPPSNNDSYWQTPFLDDDDDDGDPGGENCYLKLLIKSTTKMLFLAKSSVYDTSQAKHGSYGLHVRLSVLAGKPNYSVACLQFKCPTKGSPTYVVVSPMTSKGATCRQTGITGSLSGVQSTKCPNLPSISGPDSSICVPVSGGGNDGYYGTFRGDPLLTKLGKKRCLTGSQRTQENDSGGVTTNHPTLNYTCSDKPKNKAPLIPADWLNGGPIGWLPPTG